MSIPKILTICWSIVWSVTIFTTYDLLTYKIFMKFFGNVPRGSWWRFISTTAILVFVVWAVGCFVILITCWGINKNKTIETKNNPTKKSKDISPLAQEYLDKLKADIPLKEIHKDTKFKRFIDWLF